MNIDPRELKRLGVDAAELKNLRRAFSSPPQTANLTPDCPDVDTIWAAARQQLPGSEVESIVDHMAGCSLCAEAWRLAAGMEPVAPNETQGNDRTDDSPVSLPWWLDWRSWMAATLAMLLLIVGIRIVDPGPEPAMRGGAGSAIESLVQSTELPRDAFQLRWSSGPAGALYDVSVFYVFDEDLIRVHTAQALSETSFLVPAERFADVPTGAAIDWQVSVLMPDGGRLSSATFTTILR